MSEPPETHVFPEVWNQSAAAAAAGCPLPYEVGRWPLVVLYGAVLTVGLPANLLTLGLTWLQVRRKNVLGVYLWSLSVCDLTYLFTLPLWIHYLSQGHAWPWSSALCKLTGYVFFNNMYVSIFLLCCVSCDRYVAVVYSTESRGLRRRRLAWTVVLAVVLPVAIGHLPVFFMKEGDGAEGERHCFEPNQGSRTVAGLNYARVLVGFLVPLTLLLVTNRGILTTVRRSAGLQPQQKRRAQRLAAAAVVLFLVCFGPYHLVLLVRAIVFNYAQPHGAPCLWEERMYSASIISLGLSTVNSAINPLLYVLSSNNIHKQLSRGLAWIRHRTPPGPRPHRNQDQTGSNDDSAAQESLQGGP